MVDSSLNLWGLMGVPTCLVLSNDVPAAVKVAAELAKATFGNRIQICDGTDDDVQIQAAIDALPSGGGTVMLTEGTFDYDTTVSLPGDGKRVTLRGVGYGTVLYSNSNSLGTFIDMGVITGFGPSVIQTIEICHLTIRLDDDVTSNTNGIDLSERHRGNVHDCLFMTTTTARKLIAIMGADVNNCIIRNNHCRLVHTGISLTGDLDDNLIEGNIIDQPQYDGIYMDGTGAAAGYAFKNTIANNQVEESGGDSLHLKLFRMGSIIGNSFTESTGGHGIHLETCLWNTITANICIENSRNPLDTYSGIYVDADSDENKITDNVCANHSGGTSQKYGVELASGATKNVVTGNTLLNNVTAAILHTSANMNTVKDNIGVLHAVEQEFVYIENGSVNTLLGSCGVLTNVGQFHRSACAGDDRILGAAAENIDQNESGYVRILGVGKVKVDGTVDIGVGDMLTPEGTAGISKKAASGDMAFAQAQEAYTNDDANGLIDALLYPVRKL